ncbi:hypothetical protein BSL78_14598 [Apostichopus japonicus]|uniref:Death domain-containing protein n=1 Tax=Stichopus japonicus TaxID=307972 RepID=A0A2G8KKL2_STIJA|nr:hypothetical protein BSL78_14598 [Apostichopus japonicus]
MWKQLCHGLISELELTNKWRTSAKKEHKDFFRLESVLQSWWKDIHEGHQAHLRRFLMFLGQYGREDIRDHIEKVPDRGCFDETVLNTVILSATNSWKRFAAELGVEQRELTGKLTHDMNPYDCLRTVFNIWYTKEKGCNKLGQLLKACRAIGRETLADDIEQGLSEPVLRRIGHQIETKQWRLLGEKLLISEVRLDAFRESFQLLPERVYRMLSYWSMLQSFDANKTEMLASALCDINLGHVAEKELYKVPDRGCFDETVLNPVIHSATNSWKLFAAELGVEKHELAGKLTQGLNESVLRRMSHQIEHKQWKLLGVKLLIPDVRLDAFRETFQPLPERVYRMFSYWSMLQSFDANKIEMLASVLCDINLGHVAEKELYKVAAHRHLASRPGQVRSITEPTVPLEGIGGETGDEEEVRELVGVEMERGQERAGEEREREMEICHPRCRRCPDVPPRARKGKAQGQPKAHVRERERCRFCHPRCRRCPDVPPRARARARLKANQKPMTKTARADSPSGSQRAAPVVVRAKRGAPESQGPARPQKEPGTDVPLRPKEG